MVMSSTIRPFSSISSSVSSDDARLERKSRRKARRRSGDDVWRERVAARSRGKRKVEREKARRFSREKVEAECEDDLHPRTVTTNARRVRGRKGFLVRQCKRTWLNLLALKAQGKVNCASCPPGVDPDSECEIVVRFLGAILGHPTGTLPVFGNYGCLVRKADPRALVMGDSDKCCPAESLDTSFFGQDFSGLIHPEGSGRCRNSIVADAFDIARAMHQRHQWVGSTPHRLVQEIVRRLNDPDNADPTCSMVDARCGVRSLFEGAATGSFSWCSELQSPRYDQGYCAPYSYAKIRGWSRAIARMEVEEMADYFCCRSDFDSRDALKVAHILATSLDMARWLLALRALLVLAGIEQNPGPENQQAPTESGTVTPDVRIEIPPDSGTTTTPAPLPTPAAPPPGPQPDPDEEDKPNTRPHPRHQSKDPKVLAAAEAIRKLAQAPVRAVDVPQNPYRPNRKADESGKSSPAAASVVAGSQTLPPTAPPSRGAPQPSSPVNSSTGARKLKVSATRKGGRSKAQTNVPRKGSSDKKQRLVKQGRGHTRSTAVATAAVDAVLQERGEADALREKLEEEREMRAEMATHVSSQHEELMALQAQNLQQSQIAQMYRQRLIQLGYIDPDDPSEEVLDVYTFNGRYNVRCPPNSTYETSSDPLITVAVMKDRTYKFYVPGTSVVSMVVPKMFEGVAGQSALTEKTAQRMRNISQAIRSDKECNDYLRAHPELSRNYALLCFLLAGMFDASNGTLWLNHVEEWVPQTYTVAPPADWQERLKGVYFAPDLSAVRARYSRKIRRMPFYVDNLCPHLPDYGDPDTIRASLCKRLFPDTPAPGSFLGADGAMHPVIDELEKRARELARLIKLEIGDYHTTPATQLECVVKANDGRNATEAKQILEGFDAVESNFDAVMEEYLGTPYDSHFKLECYPKIKAKCIRLIMSLPPRLRGVQIRLMGVILKKIEIGTRKCNVKGLTAEQILEKLREKFADLVCV